MERPLNLDPAQSGIERALKFYQESVSHRLDFMSPKAPKYRSNQRSVFLQQLKRQRLIPLAQGSVPDDVSEHYGRKPADRANQFTKGGAQISE